MSDFFEKLAHGSLPGASSDHLKILGKRAAGMYTSRDADSLTDAVRQVVGEESLNSEQIHRVVQMANQETWKAMFHEGGDREANFDPADASEVIGAMTSKPNEADVSSFSYMDYLQDVKNEVPDGDIAELFGINSDAPEYEALRPAAKEQEAVEKTAAALDVARYGVNNAASLVAEAGERFYGLVKQAHVNDGHGILQISKAVGLAVEDPSFAKDVMNSVTSRLESEGIRINRAEEIKKLASHVVVNTEHPIMVAMAELERAAIAYYSSDVAHEKLAHAHKQASAALRSKIGSLK